MTKQEQQTQELLESLDTYSRFQDGWSFGSGSAPSDNAIEEAREFAPRLTKELGQDFEYDLELGIAGYLEFSVYGHDEGITAFATCHGKDDWETYQSLNWVFSEREYGQTATQALEELKKLLA